MTPLVHWYIDFIYILNLIFPIIIKPYIKGVIILPKIFKKNQCALRVTWLLGLYKNEGSGHLSNPKTALSVR